MNGVHNQKNGSILPKRPPGKKHNEGRNNYFRHMTLRVFEENSENIEAHTTIRDDELNRAAARSIRYVKGLKPKPPQQRHGLLGSRPHTNVLNEHFCGVRHIPEGYLGKKLLEALRYNNSDTTWYNDSGTASTLSHSDSEESFF